MARVRDAVPAVPGVTCGDIYANIDAAVAHVVAAVHGARAYMPQRVCDATSQRLLTRVLTPLQSRAPLTACSASARAQTWSRLYARTCGAWVARQQWTAQ